MQYFYNTYYFIQENQYCFFYVVLPFIILAMVNYYVMEFRGEPFQLLDIVGMGTAAEVVGEYSFKIKLMLGIPLIYALVFGEFVLKFQKLELGKRAERIQLPGLVYWL